MRFKKFGFSFSSLSAFLLVACVLFGRHCSGWVWRARVFVWHGPVVTDLVGPGEGGDSSSFEGWVGDDGAVRCNTLCGGVGKDFICLTTVPIYVYTMCGKETSERASIAVRGSERRTGTLKGPKKQASRQAGWRGPRSGIHRRCPLLAQTVVGGRQPLLCWTESLVIGGRGR